MQPIIELNPIQTEIIDLVTKGFSLIDVVDRKDVDRHTLVNWRRTIPAFDEALEQAVRDREALNRERMLALAWVATTTLRKIMEDDKASPSIRLRAAQTVLKAAAAIKRAEATAPAEDPAETENTHNSAQSPIRLAAQPGRNTLCPCGSGVKFKRCCANPAPQAVNTAA